MLKFRIVTPEKVVYEDEIAQVSLPTTTGEITVLPHHVPLVSVLQAGELRIVDKEGEHLLVAAGGFVEVRSNNEVIVLTDNAERAADIDIARAEAAKQRAEKQMQTAKEREDIDYAKLQTVLDREFNRIR